MILSYAFCNVSVMSVCAEPFHKAEMVNEVLFGEKVEVLEINDREWAKIRTEWDDYYGWCKLGQLSLVSKKEYRKEIKYIANSHTDKLINDDGEHALPLGSNLFGLKGSKLSFNNTNWKFKGKKTAIQKLELTGEQLIKAAMHYLNAPYRWGGRSVLGIDCSGLTQMAFKLCGARIPRDAEQQAMEGDTVDFLQHAECGDLAFFDNAEGKIVHVGILLNNHSIIHATDASGRVVIDKIDPGGIISTSLKRRTHNLRVVKRLF